MDWELIKEKYPKASESLQKWAKGEEGFIIGADPRVLYDFFDGEGIYIVMGRGGGEFFWMVDEFLDCLDDGGYEKTRTEAEEQAFLKAFEILNRSFPFEIY